LFGGGAEAGAVRYITNKPNLEKFEGKAEATYGFTAGGDHNASGNVTVNVPIIEDRFAVRAVIYDDHRGGYIDNVPSTFTRSNTDLGNYYFNIAPTGGLCPNGMAPGSRGCTLPAASAPQINNASVVEKNFNPVDYTGGRISAAFKIDDDWNILVTESLQDLKVSGISADYPTGSDFQPLAPLQTTTFTPTYDKDRWQNTAWTVNGKLGFLHLVYTGGYMTRHISQQMDYANYSRTGGGMYYQCTGGTGGLLGKGTPLRCYSPAGYWDDKVRNTHLTQELRVNTPEDKRIRALAGVFYEQFRIYDVQNFKYKTIPSCNPANLAAALAGGAPCLADVRTAPGSTANDPGIRDDNTAFGEDVQRGYNQLAFFGSLDFDIIPDVLTVSVGTRYFQYKEFEVGSQYGSNSSCLDVPNGECTGGMVNINDANDRVKYTGFKSRASINWHVNRNTLAYFTFSQGFRPGGFNRSVSGVADDGAGNPQYEKPNGYAPDSLNNYEIGVKTSLFNRRLQLNLSAYYMDWTNVQFLFFNPTQLGNTTFGVNGPDYNIKGIEGQFTARLTKELTLTGSASYNNAKQTSSPCLVSNIQASPTFGKCITEVLTSGILTPFENPFGEIGTSPAFSPKFQGNIRARYDTVIGDYKAFISGGASYTGSMYNQPATYLSGAGVTIPTTTLLRYKQPAYTTFDASIGVSKDRWTAEIYGTNLSNSHASTFTSSAQFIKSEVPIRPRVIALKIGYSF
jgi:outer membrane receptor protein involved in Fe transport